MSCRKGLEKLCHSAILSIESKASFQILIKPVIKALILKENWFIKKKFLQESILVVVTALLLFKILVLFIFIWIVAKLNYALISINVGSNFAKLELHGILRKCACFVTENIGNLSQFFIERRSIDPTALVSYL
jgi:hypothetical protein